MMSFKKIIYGLVVAMLLVAPNAFADTIISSSGAGGWQSWVTPTEGGSVFWDNTSWDGPKMNIGYLMSGANGPGPMPYWGIADGGYDSSFYFQVGGSNTYWIGVEDLGLLVGDKDYNDMFIEITTNDGSDNATYINHYAGNYPENVFGYFYIDANGNKIEHPLLWAGQTTATFTPNVNYAFYIEGPGGTFYMMGQGGQFAVFSQVPEPATMLLFGLGLMGIAGIRRKFKN